MNSAPYADLADALYQARKDYLDAMERSDVPERLRKRDVFTTLLWDNKATFELALRAAVRRDDWRPISTYKQGEVVQVWAAHNDGSPYLSFTAFKDYAGGRWCRPATADPLPFEPTHWLPLPAPPQAARV